MRCHELLCPVEKKKTQNMQKEFLEEFFYRFELHQPSPSSPVLNNVTQPGNLVFFNVKR